MPANYTGPGPAAAPVVCKYVDTIYWAEKGWVHHKCEILGREVYGQMKPDTMEKRMNSIEHGAMQAAARNRAVRSTSMWTNTMRMVEEMRAVIRKAREQGSFYNAADRREAKRRKPLTLQVTDGFQL